MKLSNKKKIELIKEVLDNQRTINSYSNVKAIKKIREIIENGNTEKNI